MTLYLRAYFIVETMMISSCNFDGDSYGWEACKLGSMFKILVLNFFVNYKRFTFIQILQVLKIFHVLNFSSLMQQQFFDSENSPNRSV